MLSRVAVLSKAPKEALGRSLYSSSKTLKGISIGGQVSSTDNSASTSRSSFAALKREIERSAAEEINKEKKADATEDTRDWLDGSIQERSPPSNARSEYSSTSLERQSQRRPSAPAREGISIPSTRQTEKMDTESSRIKHELSRKNPFERRSRLTERKDQGWGPGLREKIEEAQKIELEQRQQKVGLQHKEAGQTATKSVVHDDQEDITAAGTWQAQCEEFKRAKGVPCNVPGYEKWVVFEAKSGKTDRKHLLGRRIRVKNNSLSLCFANITSTLLSLNACPRTLFFTENGASRNMGLAYVQIEMGGYQDERLQKFIDNSTHSLKQYRGITNADYGAIKMIESIVKLHEESQTLTVRRDAGQKTASEAYSIERLDSSVELSRKEERLKRDNVTLRRDDSSPRKDQTSGTASRQRRPPTTGQDASLHQDKFEAIPASSSWTNTYDGLRQCTSSNPTSRTSTRNQVDSKKRQAMQVDSKWDYPVEMDLSESRVDVYEEGQPESIGGKSSSHLIEEATPVYVDNEQAKETAITSGSEHSVNVAHQRQGEASDAKSEREISKTSRSIEDVTPVLIDDEQASNTASISTSSANEIASDQAANVEFARDESVEEATPVLIDDQQASGMATTIGANQTSTLTEQPAKTIGSIAGESTSSDEPKVEDSTPVRVDEDQAKGTASTSGNEHAVQIARKRQELEGDNNPSNTISSIIDGSASLSHSTTRDVDDSVPVAVEGEQVGKNQ